MRGIYALQESLFLLVILKSNYFMSDLCSFRFSVLPENKSKIDGTFLVDRPCLDSEDTESDNVLRSRDLWNNLLADLSGNKL